MASQPSDLLPRSIPQNHIQEQRCGLERQHRYAKNPFDSPSLSTSSLNETDGESPSGRDEFHLERYSSNARSSHVRQASRTGTSEDKQKPDLNIITSFPTPNMPMNSKPIRINEVQAKHVGAERKIKGLSVVSHKAIRSAVSPPNHYPPVPPQAHASRPKQTSSKTSTRSKPIQRLQNAIIQRQISPVAQRIPTTVPKEHTTTVDLSTDSALPTTTPLTPAIVVTPAGEQKSWILQRRGTNEELRSGTYSIMSWNKPRHNANTPLTPRTAELENAYMSEKLETRGPRASVDSSDLIMPNSSDSARPKSQGWWNLMLSPLLRAGSLASRKGRQPDDTSPVPPLPSATEKDDSPALSTRSDPSFLVSPHETAPSPDTPRRQGLASAKESTWSRWTEWECEREATGKGSHGDIEQPRDLETTADSSGPLTISNGTGLAAEYFHACAVEQLTGQPYFECINHDCAERLPKLCSIHDSDWTRPPVLGSPFDEGRALNSTAGINGPTHADVAQSPSILGDSLSPDVLSPNVRQASIVPIVKARTFDSSNDKASETKDYDNEIQHDQNKAPPLLPASNPSTSHGNGGLPNIATFTQQDHSAPQVVEIKITQQTSSAPAPIEPAGNMKGTTSDPPATTSVLLSEKSQVATAESSSPPDPISPEGHKSLAPAGGTPLIDVENKHTSSPRVFKTQSPRKPFPDRPAFITAETEYPPLPERLPTAPVTAQDLASAPRRLSVEERRRRLEKEDAAARKVGGLWRGRACLSSKGCMGRGGRENRTKRRWIIGISLGVLVIIVVSIALAITLTRRGDETPVESQWLNLTGFPAMPTGILTIAAPRLVAQQKQCVSPTTMWSCEVPKDDQDEIGDNEPDQPNFRFEIKFRNGTLPANMTRPMRRASDPFTNDLFVPNPSPPNQPDQVFLGETTDNITAPFDGEKTPFFVTFMSTFPAIPEGFTESAKRLVRRQSNSSFLDAIPAPELAEDGSAARVLLLPSEPFPISQPVRLYNRGLQDEHYGFYTYYDKSIFLAGLRLDEKGAIAGSSNPADADQSGGSVKANAAARCTFAQTRFLFKIFTSSIFDGGLLPSVADVNSTNPDDQEATTKTNSATNFRQPGSFPYPASIVVDRHGGDIDSKAVWCYGMSNGNILKTQKVLVGENRSFGGELINASPSLSGNDTEFNRTAGGIDGGTGGCGCTWQNWE